MLRQAENDVLTMRFADTGPINLEAKAYNGGTLVLDGAGQIDLSDNVDNVVQLADDAQLQIRGGAGDDTIQAGDGGTLLDGGTGEDVLIAGTGAGSDQVQFEIGYGSDTVENFNVAEDIITLDGFELSDWDGLLALAVETDGNTIFDFGNGDVLTLQGVALADVVPTNFISEGEPLHQGPPTIQIAVGTSAAQLNAMIAEAADGTVFEFAAGNHVFDQSIIIARDNVTLMGTDSETVTVTFAFAEGAGGDGFVIAGEGDTYVSTLPDAAEAGSNLLQLRDGHGFEAGDVIYIQQPNTAEYLAENGWTNVSIEEAEFRPFRESIHTIESVVGNTVVLSTPVAYDLAAGEGRYYSMDVASGVTLSGLTITYDLGEPDANDFTNTHAAFDATSAVLLNNTAGVTLTDFNFVNVASTALNLSSTIDASVSDVSITGAHNKGGGGNGYGIELHEAFNNTLTDLEIFDMRHSVVLSAWHAEVDNTVEINATNRDINLHGSSDHGNTITVDYAALEYLPDGTGDNWMIVSAGGTNHAMTDMSANEITFGTAVGANRNDTIVGSDDGSVLVGAYGYDVLVGCSSADVLIGGTRKDTMTGNEGSDTFLLVMGDDLDTITDFEFGIGGDTLIFSGNTAVVDASDLTISEDGSDIRVRYGSNSTVILKDTTLGDIDEANFQFDPNSLITVDDYLVG